MTGAPLPHGTGRVVMIEHCRQHGDIVVLGDPPHGKLHVRKAGSDFLVGDELLATGTRMTPARLVVAAAADLGDLHVWRRPRILLVATGDETSRGDRDFGRSAFASLGLDVAFADVAMKPGKPVWYGRVKQTHILGLPGNPTAALTVARLFLAPLIASLSGGATTDALPWQLRQATRPIPANGPSEAFLRGSLCYRGAAICDRQDASGQAALALADCLVRRSANAPAVNVGELVSVLPLC